ncbi:Protoheme IX farnesyltransferase [Emticicia oligotrophica DSM 17448]|uniref:Protoheme IX farnesyltransferase n=1 Tax=Emticicia oligotrophica (strain DSM 17448 / CIP 109782 / MTCC 6937 / GPTSA100-15) TaxID=929562 RepID=A0ABM5N0D5_EMTOG|nr:MULTISPECIES: heme o synthase [Emticicia]AFK02874.1 Protoheme IX farnesyltransferase [Emticicia oligotrophica DSM 17448]
MSLVATQNIFAQKFKAYYDITKFRLSSTVVFSGAFGFILASDSVQWKRVMLFAIAAFCTTAAANIINQIIEKDLDKLMKRTENRPLPSGRLSVKEAMIFGMVMASIATYILFFEFNYRAGLLAILSMVLYGFVYTPLKRVGPIAVAVGALPGAFPPMIGWIASSGHFGLEPGILFAIQFFWQFPHFWAIAWVLDEDYSKAGFKLLPSEGGQNLNSAIQIMIYTLFLLPLCWVPFYLGMTGINSAVVAMVFGVLFLAQTFHLMRKVDRKAALQLMFGSFIYLPVVQIAYLLDKV